MEGRRGCTNQTKDNSKVQQEIENAYAIQVREDSDYLGSNL